jgi:hypothetical protein
MLFPGVSLHKVYYELVVRAVLILGVEVRLVDGGQRDKFIIPGHCPMTYSGRGVALPQSGLVLANDEGINPHRQRRMERSYCSQFQPKVSLQCALGNLAASTGSLLH